MSFSRSTGIANFRGVGFGAVASQRTGEASGLTSARARSTSSSLTSIRENCSSICSSGRPGAEREFVRADIDAAEFFENDPKVKTVDGGQFVRGGVQVEGVGLSLDGEVSPVCWSSARVAAWRAIAKGESFELRPGIGRGL